MLAFTKPFRRVLQLEMNEVSRPLIQTMIDRGQLPAFKEVCQNWSFYRTTSEPEYKNIEPWIQWVTAHTGKTYEEHGIFRLGDSLHLQHPQIWEVLGKNNHESVVLSGLNARRGATRAGVFFPDPWSKAEDVYPESLKGLWNVVSRRVQGHATSPLALSDLMDGLRSVAGQSIAPSTVARVAKQLVRQKLNPKQSWRLAGHFDLLLADIMANFLKDRRYSFCSLFLNSLAHYQHHFWRNHAPSKFATGIMSPDCGPADDPVSWGYKNYEQVLSKMLKAVSLDDTLVLIASGLTQVPFTAHDHEGGWNYYRLKDHDGFAMKALGLSKDKVFPMMSRDWQVGPFNDGLLVNIQEALAGIQIGGQPVFATSRAADNFIFIETALTRHIDSQERVTVRGAAIGAFGEYFEKIAVKSGHHSGVGYLWSSAPLPGLANNQHIPLTVLPDIALAALGLNVRMNDSSIRVAEAPAIARPLRPMVIEREPNLSL